MHMMDDRYERVLKAHTYYLEYLKLMKHYCLLEKHQEVRFKDFLKRHTDALKNIETEERDERDPNGLLLVQPWEQDQLSRLIEYLDVVKTPHRNTADRELLEHDFKVFYEQYDARRGKDFRKTFPNLVEFYDNINVIPLTKPEHDIQQPKDASIYAHRTVSEDGEVVVQGIRHRKTGESTEWYDNPLDPEARAEVLKKIGGSSIGWDTEVDGLGGTEDDENR